MGCYSGGKIIGQVTMAHGLEGILRPVPFFGLNVLFHCHRKERDFSQIKHWIVRNDLRYCLLLLNFSLIFNTAFFTFSLGLLSNCDCYILKYSVCCGVGAGFSRIEYAKLTR